MKTIHLILFVLIIILSCDSDNNSGQKPVITVSILPQKYFVQQVAGDRYDINVMIPPGVSPATYDPSPGNLKQLSRSSAYFRIGTIGFENSWMEKIASVNKAMKVFDLSSGVELIVNKSHLEKRGHHLEEPSHHRHNIDPHIWMSPKGVKTICHNIYIAMKTIDPGDSLFYKNNYLGFAEEIDSLDTAISESLSGLRHRTFFIYHPALTYFASDYRLEQISIENEGKSPSPMHLKQMINLARKEKIKTILIQEQYDIENARILSKEIQGKIIKINPLDENWRDQILHITNELYTTLRSSTDEKTN